MTKKQLVIQHDLSQLNQEQIDAYLREVSEFIGLDPDLNGLDTIWMVNESGPGQSRVVYARRGTAEILRNNRGIDVSSLTDKMVKGSIVFTATGKDKTGRQEIATGSKNIENLNGKALDDGIMTASTRALRRLTMQFTSLGILDESEVKAVMGDTNNPASNAQPIGAPIVFPPPQVAPNNAPGKDVTKPLSDPDRKVDQQLAPSEVVAEGVKALAARPVGQTAQERAEAGIKAAVPSTNEAVTPAVTPVTGVIETVTEAAIGVITGEPVKPKRARKSKNTVSLEGPEPEVVSATATVSTVVESSPKSEIVPEIIAPIVSPQAPVSAVVPVSGTSVPSQGTDFPGKPSDVQMAEYRKKVSTYTSELPSSENMGSVQKMRAFITRMSGTAPQFMTVDQWQEMLGWFESFVEKNKIKGLVSYVNDSLGVK
jgi:hypothetical protein